MGYCEQPSEQAPVSGRSDSEKKRMAYPRGLEPLTFWSVARRSIQLSYRYAFVADELLHYDRKRDFQIGDGAKSGENVIGQ